MKKIVFFLIFGFILNFAVNAQNSKAFPFKCGTIEYTMNMMGTDNTINLYFEDEGKTQCTETLMEMFGMKIHNRNIIADNKVYVLDMAKKTYTETAYDAEGAQKMNYYASDEEMTKEGATKIGEEEVLGRNCQIYTMNKDGADIKLWMWKGMMLKMETAAQGMTVTMVAKNISESAPDKTFFVVPSDFTKN